VGRAARLTRSVALRADARHLWTNVAQAAAVIVALALVAVTGHTVFDPIVALALAAYLLWTAGQVFLAALGEIMDVRLPPEEERLVEQCLREQHDDGLRGYHGLRTRKAGRQRYIEVHLELDPARTVAEAHELCERVERAICACLPGAVVTIHFEPAEQEEAALLEKRAE
jgi:cation diffusion facilitator family transporter